MSKELPNFKRLIAKIRWELGPLARKIHKLEAGIKPASEPKGSHPSQEKE